MRRELAVFAAWRSEGGAFHVAGTPRRQRLFQDEHVVSLGVRWTPERGRSLAPAFGYAFDREFEIENDSGRELGTARLSDEPFVTLSLSWRF